MSKSFEDYGISVNPFDSGEFSTRCPECSDNRTKNPGAKCLSVNIEKGTWYCQHCAWKGGLGLAGASTKDKYKPTYTKTSIKTLDASEANFGDSLSDKQIEWLSDRRGISLDTIKAFRLGSATLADKSAIAFPYYLGENLVNVKKRTGDKRFSMEKGADLIPYNINSIVDKEVIAIVEGEIDALSLHEAGFTAVVSVPNGAPNENEKNVDKRFEPFLATKEYFEPAREIILAVDNDGPGRRLEEELARRFGKGRCKRVVWPDGCKDANDVLINHGASVLLECLKNAEHWPLEGITEIPAMESDIDEIFLNGLPPGESTGWPTLDEFYTVSPGRLTIINGTPSSGKSSYAENLIVNLAKLHGFRAAIYSPEHYPIALHAMRLAQCWTGKSPNTKMPALKMSADDLQQAKAMLNHYFTWLTPEEGESTLDGILDRASQLVYAKGIKVLLIDPFNELEGDRPSEQSESEYIGRCLSKMKRFAQRNDVHLVLVVHPAKMYKDKNSGEYPVPTAYDIAGSAHFRNKADFIMTVHREMLGESSNMVDIYIQKAKHINEGKIGVVTLQYGTITATFRDIGVSRQ